MTEHLAAPAPSVDPRPLRRYRRAAIVSTGGVAFLTVAGGVVRLTGSGLGCDDWPACNEERFIDVSTGHAAIEQLNRLLSGVIGLPVLLLAIFAFRVTGRAGLRWPAIGVFLTVVANGVVGGFAVRGDLHPALVQSHFLLAMASLVFGTIAVLRSGEHPIRFRRLIGTNGMLALALTTLTAGALVTGTIVTGTGPHAGDEDARRFGFDISNVARTHSVTVLVTIAVAVWLAWRVTRVQRSPTIANALSAWLFIGLLQAALGYAQYFNGVPELLVGVHIAQAAALWVVTIRLVVLATSEPSGAIASATPAALGEGSHDVHGADVTRV